MWKLEFAKEWNYWYEKLDNSVIEIVGKRLARIEENDREYGHLGKGLPFFKDEFHDQFRICFHEDRKSKTRTLHFVGDHKQYERWLGMRA
ncbi:MAG: hypothetical protein WCY41_03355 [Candidatus Micrarchaeia archaeon]